MQVPQKHNPCWLPSICADSAAAPYTILLHFNIFEWFYNFRENTRLWERYDLWERGFEKSCTIPYFLLINCICTACFVLYRPVYNELLAWLLCELYMTGIMSAWSGLARCARAAYEQFEQSSTIIVSTSCAPCK